MEPIVWSTACTTNGTSFKVWRERVDRSVQKRYVAGRLKKKKKDKTKQNNNNNWRFGVPASDVSSGVCDLSVVLLT